MTAIVPIDAPNFRTEAQRRAHNQTILAELAVELQAAKRKRTREKQGDKAAGYAQTPAGRKHLRGFPIAGMGGLDIRRDPVRELMARERARLKGSARKAYDAIEEARIAR